IVLALRRHGERPWHRHLDRPVRVGAQEFDVADLDRVLAPNRTNDPRHRGKPAGTVRGLAGTVESETVERRGKAGGITLPALFALRGGVECHALLIPEPRASGG